MGSTSALTAGARYGSYARWLSMTRFKRKTGWFLDYGGTRVFLENLCDFLTTRDLHVGRHYERLDAMAENDAVVWDIGMNLCSVSLMFASNPRVTRVYGYELMVHSFNCAIKSLRMNEPVVSGVDSQSLLLISRREQPPKSWVTRSL
jgi:hypothetical protein